MKELVGTWFECKVKYMKMLDNGLQKKVTELYVADGVSWAEAEVRMTKAMGQITKEPFEITAMNKTRYKEVFIDGDANIWYKAKVQFTTINEKLGREKKQFSYFLVNGMDIEDAKKSIDNAFGNSMLDYTVSKLEETAILDVFLHEEEKKI